MNEDRPSRDGALAAAMERLRTVFAPYPARYPVPGCPHCITPAYQEELAAGSLATFAFKALTTWGDIEDFKHFLPRLLAFDAEMTLGKLAYAECWGWPAPERQAVHAYGAALWEQQLASGDDDTGAIDLLRRLAAIGLDPSPLLARWRALLPGPGMRQLMGLLDSHEIYALPGARDSVSPLLLAWLLESGIAGLLEEAFFAAQDDEAGALSQASARLALLAAINGRGGSLR